MDQTGSDKQLRKSRLLGSIWVVEYTNGHRELCVEIKIDCPDCGQSTAQYAGHHILALVEILHQAIEMHPDLVQAEMKKITDHTITGEIPEDPSRN